MQPWETSAMPGLPTAAVGQAIRPERRCQVFFRAYGMEQELVLPTCCVAIGRRAPIQRAVEHYATGKAGAEHDQHEQCEPDPHAVIGHCQFPRRSPATRRSAWFP